MYNWKKHIWNMDDFLVWLSLIFEAAYEFRFKYCRPLFYENVIIGYNPRCERIMIVNSDVKRKLSTTMVLVQPTNHKNKIFHSKALHRFSHE